jgi:hypothetical protein
MQCIRSCLRSDIGGHDPLQEALAEIERLVAAKRRALVIADALQAALKNTRDALATLAYYDVTNLGSEQESGRPPRYFECRLCGDWNDAIKDIEHADGCPARARYEQSASGEVADG